MTMIAAPMTPARSPRRLADDAQVARGERQRALEDDLAHAGEQVLVDLADVAADDDDARVEEVDAGGEHLAERAAGLADQRIASGLPSRTRWTTSRLVGVASPRPASRWASARPPATASRQPVLPQRQTTSSWSVTTMWPMSPAAPSAPRWMRRAGDDAAADAGADLDVQQVLDVAPVRPVLAEGHDVDVVVDEHRARRGSARRTSRGIEKPSQPGMIGGLTGSAGAERDRAGDADADAADLARPVRPASASSSPEALVDARRGPRSGPVGDVHVEGRLARARAPRGRCTASARVGGAEVGGEHDARVVVEREQRSGGRPPVDSLSPAS